MKVREVGRATRVTSSSTFDSNASVNVLDKSVSLPPYVSLRERCSLLRNNTDCPLDLKVRRTSLVHGEAEEPQRHIFVDIARTLESLREGRGKLYLQEKHTKHKTWNPGRSTKDKCSESTI